ncbi:hypothetical protein PHMEG_0002045 [Phytophthora megakarya]|uniref:Uncharacterized protein n=1 Tax=Phytophthora megakarya TaxID=4795 RepID=A0A225X056_9STRA|nr:hypothetical protein PHMEG_0002045 [Phytophthora megakarya]
MNSGIFRGLKRVEVENDQAGGERKPGKEPLTFSLYTQLAERTLGLADDGFAHLFLLSQWNLMCRSKSVETLHISHLHSADDSIECLLHKTKTSQEGSGPKDPRHIYANHMQPSCCWILALGMYFASNPSLIPGKLFPGSNQKSRFCKVLGKMLKEITGHINSGVDASGHVEMQRPVNQEQADLLYHFGISKLHFKPSKHPHKQRPERAVTTLRRIRQAIHDADPEARSVPYRKRKRKEH